jgi:hypothetical protein
MESDIPDLRELLKALKISAEQAKQQAANMQQPDTGEV